MAERNEDILRRYKLYLDELNDTLGYKTNPSTGGKSANHDVSKRKKKKGAKGALDFGKNNSRMNTKENRKTAARIARKYKLNSIFEPDAVHIDDNEDKMIEGKPVVGSWDANKPLSQQPEWIKKEAREMRKEGEEVKAKQAYYFGYPIDKYKSLDTIKREPQSMDTKVRETEMRNPFPRPEEEENPIQKINSLVNQKTGQAEETSRILSTNQGRKFASNSIDQQTSSGQLNPYVATNLKETIKNNPEEVVNAPMRNLAKQEENKQPGVKDSFLEALTFFLPQIGGMVVGGLIEGTEGAVAGGEQGAKLGDAFREYKMKQQTLQAPSKVDITPDYQLKGTGEPVFSRRRGNTAEFVTADGKVVSPLSVESKTAAEARIRQEGISSRAQAVRSESQNKMVEANKKTFMGRPDIAVDIEALDQIDRLEALVDSGTPLVGQIDFKMAKGIAGEVGNLAVEERKAAAQLVGYKGELSNFKEWITGSLDSTRAEAIKNLIPILRKGAKRRVYKKASMYAKGSSKRLGTNSDDYSIEIMDTLGIDVSDIKSGSGVGNIKVDKNALREEMKRRGLK